MQKDLTYAGNRAMLVYRLPLNEVVFDFYDRLKSVSRGYASFDYQLDGYEEGDLVLMNILVNGEPVDALGDDRPSQPGRAPRPGAVRAAEGADPAAALPDRDPGGDRRPDHRPRDGQGVAQGRARQMLWRRRRRRRTPANAGGAAATRRRCLCTCFDPSFVLFVETADLDEAIDLANAFAGEHLCLAVRDPWTWLWQRAARRRRVPGRAERRGDRRLHRRAEPHHADRRHGALFVAGERGRLREDHLGVRPESRTTCAKPGPPAVILARAESLEAHARAVECRLEALGDVNLLLGVDPREAASRRARAATGPPDAGRLLSTSEIARASRSAMVIDWPSLTAEPLENVSVPNSEIGSTRRRANGASSIHSAELSVEVYCTRAAASAPRSVGERDQPVVVRPAGRSRRSSCRPAGRSVARGARRRAAFRSTPGRSWCSLPEEVCWVPAWIRSSLRRPPMPTHVASAPKAPSSASSGSSMWRTRW